MATFNLAQQNATFATNVGCSGRSLGGTVENHVLTNADTIGARTEFNSNIGNGVSNAIFCQFRSQSITFPTTWAAGDYIIRINVTSAGSNNTWTEAYICERTSGGVYNLVASATGLGINLNTTGVKTTTVNRATDYTAQSGSQLSFILVGTNTSTHGNNRFGITPDQFIDTPIVEPAVTLRVSFMELEYKPL